MTEMVIEFLVVSDENNLHLTFPLFVVFKGETANRRRRPQTADPKIKKRSKSCVQGDIWEKVGEKWKGQDKVMKLLKKFNVRY